MRSAQVVFSDRGGDFDITDDAGTKLGEVSVTNSERSRGQVFWDAKRVADGFIAEGVETRRAGESDGNLVRRIWQTHQGEFRPE